MDYKTYFFKCSGRDINGYPDEREDIYIHTSEEQARRGLIYTLNHLFNFYPKRVTLLKVEKCDPNIWSQLD